MPGSAGPAPGCVPHCGEPGGATGNFCEACGTELASVSVRGGGCAGASHDDGDTATAKLGRAVALARQSGNEDTAKLHAKVVDAVDAVDAVSGTARLKKVEDADEMAIDITSTMTVRTRK